MASYKLKDEDSTLKVFQVGEIRGIISEEKYNRLLGINPAYAELFEKSNKEPEPLFVDQKEAVKESKPKTKKDDTNIQA